MTGVVAGTNDAPRAAANKWQAKRGAALMLRAFVLVAPVGAAVVAAYVLTRTISAPVSAGARVAWFAVVLTVCTTVSWPARSVASRLLPLAALLELSILFPGRAPSRYAVARQAGNVRQLEIIANGVPDSDPVRAATTILALVASLSRHDRVTRGHSERVRIFTDVIVEEVGLPEADRERLRWAALIHDIGKLEVPASLLRKRGKPSQVEWVSLRSHPEAGARIVAPLADWLGPYARVVLEHHERFDGTGYPYGLVGTQISLGARIVALADAFEVMTAARPYKRATSRASALREVARCSGTHFDPALVRAFLNVSTPRLRKALGPASVIGQVPVIGTAPMSALPDVAAQLARGAGTAVLGGVAGVVVSAAPMAGAPAPAAPPAHAAGTYLGDRTSRAETIAMNDSTVSAGHPSVASDPTGPPGATVVPAPTDAADEADPATSPRRGEPAPSTGPSRAQAGTSTAGEGTSAQAPTGDAPVTVGGGTAGGTGGGTPGGTAGGSVGGAVGGVTGGVAGVVGGTVGVVGGVAGVVGGTVGSVGDLVTGVGSTADGILGGPVGSTVSGVTDPVGDLLDGLGGAVGGSTDPAPESGGVLGKLLGGLLGRR